MLTHQDRPAVHQVGPTLKRLVDLVDLVLGLIVNQCLLIHDLFVIRCLRVPVLLLSLLVIGPVLFVDPTDPKLDQNVNLHQQEFVQTVMLHPLMSVRPVTQVPLCLARRLVVSVFDPLLPFVLVKSSALVTERAPVLCFCPVLRFVWLLDYLQMPLLLSPRHLSVLAEDQTIYLFHPERLVDTDSYTDLCHHRLQHPHLF